MDSPAQNNSCGRDIAARKITPARIVMSTVLLTVFLPAADRDLLALPALAVLQLFPPLRGGFAFLVITYLLKQ
jgi:hypothetical protein